MRYRFSVLLLLFIADRLLKHFVWFFLKDVRGGFIHPVLNVNSAFSFPIPPSAREAFTIAVMVVSILLLLQSIRLSLKGERMFFWWGLIAVGAISNSLDRLQLGGVLDYIDVSFWPVFNTSDMYITAGVGMMIAADLFFRRRTASSVPAQ